MCQSCETRARSSRDKRRRRTCTCRGRWPEWVRRRSIQRSSSCASSVRVGDVGVWQLPRYHPTACMDSFGGCGWSVQPGKRARRMKLVASQPLDRFPTDLAEVADDIVVLTARDGDAVLE